MNVGESDFADRRCSVLTESQFKDFRDYTSGTIENFSVSEIFLNMDKVSHFGSIKNVIARNVEQGQTCDTTGKRNVLL